MDNNSSDDTAALGESLTKDHQEMDTWEPTPSFTSLIRASYRIAGYAWVRKAEGRETFMQSLVTDLETMQRITVNEILVLVFIAVTLTGVRQMLSSALFTPLACRLQLDSRNVAKFPESAWKLMVHGTMWTYTCYILIHSGRHPFFHRPSTVWKDWSMNMPVHRDIYVMYILEAAYYLHGLHALIFYDVRRKDRMVMFAHHIICEFLLWLSYVQRCHNVGILVVFLHDVSDILLELVKIFVYFRSRRGVHYIVWGMLAQIFFVLLLASWATTRLYYYPLKAIYATSGILLDTNNKAVLNSCSVFMVIMLYAILVMDIYWFGIISMILYKSLRGSLKHGVEDIREEEDEAEVALDDGDGHKQEPARTSEELADHPAKGTAFRRQKQKKKIN